MNHLKKTYYLLLLLLLTNCNNSNNIDTDILGKDAISFHRICTYECEKLSDSLNLNTIQKKVFRIASLMDTVVLEIIDNSGGKTRKWSMAKPNATINVEKILDEHNFFKVIEDNINSINEYNQDLKYPGLIYLNNDVYDVLFDEKSLFNKKHSNKILASQLIINLSALEHHMFSVINSDVIKGLKE